MNVQVPFATQPFPTGRTSEAMKSADLTASKHMLN